MKLSVVDTETTGLDSETCAICEVGAIDFTLEDEKTEIGSSVNYLVDPEMPIPPEVSAVTHIIDEDVAGKLKIGEVAEELAYLLKGYDALVAHNAQFDHGFLNPHLEEAGLRLPWLCTWRLALHFYPDAPTHSLQTLRYWLKLEGIDRDGPAHRAWFDALVAAKLFERMVSDGLLDEVFPAWKTSEPLEIVEALRAYQFKPAMLKRIPIGKHRGGLFSEAPTSYVRWLSENMNPSESLRNRDIVGTARAELRRRGELT